MKFSKWLIVALLVLLTTGGAWSQERSGLRLGGGVEVGGPGAGHTGKPQPPMSDFDENMWGMNKKLLVDATMSHYLNLLRQSEIAVSNSVALSNRQNNDAHFVSHLGQLRTLNAGLLAGSNVGASQGRQQTAADVAMGQSYQNATLLNQQAAQIYMKLADVLVPIITEALRNPPAGMSSTGRPPVNTDGQ